MLSAALLAACGDGNTKSREEVVSNWSQALNVGDNEAAADLFANGATVEAGRQAPLTDHKDALAFNTALPCGARIVDQSLKGDEVRATFTLTRRPDHLCRDTHQTTRIAFRIEDGKITLWRQLPSGDATSKTP